MALDSDPGSVSLSLPPPPPPPRCAFLLAQPARPGRVRGHALKSLQATLGGRLHNEATVAEQEAEWDTGYVG
ncbi:hypothetical protein MYCTH_2130919 [Thermothelomyces thermophilus ATCC 42464]|uniref:Uncharacterized protein n=1 Tax=Thermothelomyces thermophilus (strain ATCC 42464 / BCRC 31852 / DSM 1799) TaxID=573729 RepID=G2QQ83_THET4|nr:uncharacterized protein MYCTH_2130919 [Thermothelomyces thermophilus ATCC 42464]AEO61746.1 hypothetical protein MYCTH_2130919 [Thermothelomyces thermophilus ATCC 42464]